MFCLLMTCSLKINAGDFSNIDNDYFKSSGTCQLVSIFAEQIMKNRQRGFELVTMMEVSYLGGAFDQTIIDLIKEAYEKPVFKSEKAKESAIEDFKDRAIVDCNL